MRQVKQTKEILTTRVWEVRPSYAQSLKPMFEAYLNRESESSMGEEDDHASGWFALKSMGFKNHRLLRTQVVAEADESEELVLSENPEWDMQQHWWNEEGPLIKPDDEFIDIIDMTSSVTRNGGWCSAGSIEHRDQMIFASSFPNCIGHLFVVDTPGGSAYSKNDYQQAIEAAHSAGQPVLVWIDGMCCSAGVAASVQADEIYVQHPNCEVGCIGTMAAFYTIADGEKEDTRSNYVYHEVYDPESFEKNLEFRELANNGNADPLLKDLAEDGAAFRALVRANRPAVKEEMLHGKVYKASELYGILVDGQKTFDGVVERIVELKGGAALIDHAVKVSSETEEPVILFHDTQEESPSEPLDIKEVINIKTNTDMKQYENINKVLELENIPVTADGSIANLDPASCEVINNLLGDRSAAEESLLAYKESVSQLNAKVKELNEQLQSLTQKKLESDTSALSKDATISNLQGVNVQLTTERDILKQQLLAKETELNNLKSELQRKDQEIEELSNQTTEVPAAAPAPVVEHQQEEAANIEVVHRIYTRGMTPAEKTKAKAERMAQLNAMRM